MAMSAEERRVTNMNAGEILIGLLPQFNENESKEEEAAKEESKEQDEPKKEEAKE
jgi:hypothetical protein